MNFKVVDCCPVPDKGNFPELLLKIKAETGCSYQSIYRGSDPGAAKYLQGNSPCYKHDQRWIYAHYPPGVANPPGRSTHELFSDGVAFAGPVGRRLFYWQCGIDVDDAHVQAVIRCAAKHGWTATVTYPGSSVEYHHINFRRMPVFNPFPTLKHGDHSVRVRRLAKRLAFVFSPKTNLPYLQQDQVRYTFDGNIEAALKRFQSEHHQKGDGVYGIQTSRQLDVSVRREKVRQKNWKKELRDLRGERAVIIAHAKDHGMGPETKKRLTEVDKRIGDIKVELRRRGIKP